MRMQGIKSLVAAVSSVLVIGLIVAAGSQPGDMAAVPEARAAQAAAPEFVSTALPELPTGALEGRAMAPDDIPGILDFNATPSATAAIEPLEEPPGEDTKVLTRPSVVPTVAIPSVVKQSSGAILSMPIQGRKTSRFGMRFHPVRHIWKLHSGLDLAAPCGTPVGAAAPGTVVRTGWAGGNGIQVKVDHGTLAGHRVTTTYNHLSAIGVRVGQKVETHQGVGRVGTTGFSTGCHLHFEVIADGQFTNPEPWLNGGAVVVNTDGMGTGVPSGPGSSLPGTPTNTLPLAPSPSPSPSPATPTPSPSPSVSVIPSAVPSVSPSVSPSPSPSAQPSPSVSVTPTPKDSPQPCVTPSVQPSPGVDPVPDPCASATPSASPTASPSPSPSASTSPSESPSQTPTDSTSPSASPSATPIESPSASQLPSATPPLSSAPGSPTVTRTLTQPPATSTQPPPTSTKPPITSAPPPSTVTETVSTEPDPTLQD